MEDDLPTEFDLIVVGTGNTIYNFLKVMPLLYIYTQNQNLPH